MEEEFGLRRFKREEKASPVEIIRRKAVGEESAAVWR